MRIAFVAFCSAIAIHASAAQEWHTVEASRQIRDTGEVRVHAEYTGGTLDIRSTTAPVLFGLRLRYNGDNGQPVHSYDSVHRSLTVGLSEEGIHEIAHHMNNETAGDMHLELSPQVPIALAVDLGAATARVDLGGLRLNSARLHSGAAEMSLNFSAPNLAKMSLLEMDVGAAGLDATGLASANTSNIRVNAGVGAIDLTMDGVWTQDVALQINATLGKVTVRVPSDVGVQVEADRLLGGFEHPDLVKRGDVYVSANWDTAPFKLRVHASTVLGDIDIERVSAHTNGGQ